MDTKKANINRKKVILYGAVIFIFLAALAAKAYSFSAYDMEKQIKAAQEDFSISIYLEAEVLSLQQGSFSVLKLGIDIKSYYELTLNYTLKSDLIVTISPYPDKSRYPYTKIINIKVPKDAEVGEHKIQIEINADNGFKEKTLEKEIIVNVTQADPKYIFVSNINNSIPQIEVKEWEKNMHAIGKEIPVDNFEIKVMNTGATSDFFPIFKGDSNCFTIVPNFYYVNLQSNIENTLYFTIYFDNNTNCKDTVFQVFLKDTHTGKEYSLGNEYIIFLKETEIGQPAKQEENAEQDKNIENKAKEQDKNTTISGTGSTSTAISKAKINKMIGLFSLENRGVTWGIIALVLFIIAVVLFKPGGVFNNTVSVKKFRYKLQENQASKS